MTKAFTQHERELIRKSLIAACKECWNRYGYRKTGIRELTAMADISAAAFYQFFPSKELLFFETAQDYGREMELLFHENMERHPNKQGVAESLKAVAAFIRQTAWIRAMWDEWPIIARKLPPEFIEQDFAADATRIKRLAKQYGLKMQVSMEEATRIIDILLTSIAGQRFIPGNAAKAVSFIIDATIERLIR